MEFSVLLKGKTLISGWIHISGLLEFHYWNMKIFSSIFVYYFRIWDYISGEAFIISFVIFKCELNFQAKRNYRNFTVVGFWKITKLQVSQRTQGSIWILLENILRMYNQIVSVSVDIIVKKKFCWNYDEDRSFGDSIISNEKPYILWLRYKLQFQNQKPKTRSILKYGQRLLK